MALSSGKLARWYVQLAASLEAGLTLDRAMSALSGPPAEAREALRQRLLAGDPLDAALEKGALWLPEIDRQLMGAAAAAGRLPEMLRRLSARHEAAAGAGRMALMMTLYPVFVAHFAVIVLPIDVLVHGAGLGAYLAAVTRILVPMWLVGGLAIFAVRRRWRIATAVIDCVPFLRGYRRFRALADLAFVLEAQLLAGVRLDAAWITAARATGDRRLESAASAVSESVRSGAAVAPLLENRREFPEPFATFYANGEQTGRLDESLQYLQRHFGDAAGMRLKIAVLTYPNVLFVLIAVWIAVKIFGFYLGYFEQYEQIR